MKAIILTFLLTFCIWAQIPEAAQDAVAYELTFRKAVEPIDGAPEFTIGDSMTIEWGYMEPQYPMPDNWLAFTETQIKSIANTPDLWGNDLATISIDIGLNYGYWQLRVRAVGETGLKSEFSPRVNFYLKPENPGTPATLRIIFR